MLFFLGGRMPYLGAIIGAAVGIWGLVAHSILLTVIGVAVLILGVYRTISSRRR